MAERTITINGLSKTYSVTGWRVGWTISPPSLTGAIRKVHDFLTVGAAAPLQEAGVVALNLPAVLLRTSSPSSYRRRRDMLLEILERHRFTCYKPYGAYYIMTDIGAFRLCQRRRVRAISGEGCRRGGRPRQQLLPQRRGRPDETAVLLLQARRNALREGRQPACEQAGTRLS